jgi:hypothetical protein
LFKTRYFGDWSLSPFSGEDYLVGSNIQTEALHPETSKVAKQGLGIQSPTRRVLNKVEVELKLYAVYNLQTTKQACEQACKQTNKQTKKQKQTNSVAFSPQANYTD